MDEYERIFQGLNQDVAILNTLKVDQLKRFFIVHFAEKGQITYPYLTENLLTFINANLEYIFPNITFEPEAVLNSGIALQAYVSNPEQRGVYITYIGL